MSDSDTSLGPVRGTARGAQPVAVTITGVVFVGVGSASLGAGVWRYLAPPASTAIPAGGGSHLFDLGFVVISALAAIVGGAYVLRGRDWARWLVTFWLAAHVALSAMHAGSELAVHAVLFAGVPPPLPGARLRVLPAAVSRKGYCSCAA
jgi:hypothetical protein